jgi:hypothetical protein
MRNKKAAVELSIGTIVIIVLAMSMLILGLVLIREIKNLFVSDDERAILKLTGNTANVKQGSDFGVAFGVRNVDRGSVGSQEYRYETKLDDPEVRDNCGVSEDEASRWVRFGAGSLAARPGELDAEVIKVVIPEDAPLCETKYRIKVFKGTGNELYEDLSFFVKIEPKGLF